MLYILANCAIIVKICADVVELADTQDLGSCARACRFKSCHPHQTRIKRTVEVRFSLDQKTCAVIFYINFLILSSKTATPRMYTMQTATCGKLLLNVRVCCGMIYKKMIG